MTIKAFCCYSLGLPSPLHPQHSLYRVDPEEILACQVNTVFFFFLLLLLTFLWFATVNHASDFCFMVLWFKLKMVNVHWMKYISNPVA